MSERDYDAIVIGAGHNGMVCALTLARARKRVLVVERSESIGGAARAVDFGEFSIPCAAQLDYGMDRRLVAELELERHGLSFANADIGTRVFDGNGARVDYALTRDDATSLAGLDAGDARRWPAFRQRMLRFASIISDIAWCIPPRLGSGDGRDARAWLAIAWGLRRLGRKDMREFLRIGAINIFDVLEEQFDHPLFKGALAAEAVLGHGLAPRSPNSVLTFLMRMAGSGGAVALPRGGMSAVADALKSACEARGVSFRLNAPVVRIVIENDRAAGVELESGEVLRAPVVVSNADPRTTCLTMVGAEHLDTGFVRRVNNVRGDGVTARVDLLLDDLTGIAGTERGDLARRMLYAPHMDVIERAFNDSKYGRVSSEPLVEVVIPTLLDGSRWQGRRHHATALVQYAPRRLVEDEETARAAVLERTLGAIDRMVPGLSSRVAASRVLMPADIERELGNAGGHWHHAEIALDQFFMLRPVPGLARYRLPVDGVWLCGAGTHPGGGINGLPGRHAARQILAE